MKCLIDLKKKNPSIEYGDILIYSENKAFLIVYEHMSHSEANAIQIFNNGNKELGSIDCSNKSIESLIEELYKKYGEPIKIVNIKDVSISF